jgi:pyruvate dehydrogenase E1 component beta subunit
MHTLKKIRDNEAIHQSMEIDNFLICYGLGVTDPKAVFGTTANLERRFGNERVFDMPTSENAMTGVAIGASLDGIKSIMCHQRVDFFLLAMDQLVNSAAKWHYMFGGQQSVPITIRLITGRGWGQGPTHSQNLHSWLTHIPGLKVVMPAFASDVKKLLIASVNDPNPVIFIEDRWCHMQRIDRNLIKDAHLEIGKAEVIETGNDLTIVSAGFSTIQSLRAVKFLKKHEVNVELVDLKTLKPLDIDAILTSVTKTGKLLVVDSGTEISSFASEIISVVTRLAFNKLRQAPEMITAPDVPEPTSHGVIGEFKFNSTDIAKKTLKILNKNLESFDFSELTDDLPDVPNSNFSGPF